MLFGSAYCHPRGPGGVRFLDRDSASGLSKKPRFVQIQAKALLSLVIEEASSHSFASPSLPRRAWMAGRHADAPAIRRVPFYSAGRQAQTHLLRSSPAGTHAAPCFLRRRGAELGPAAEPTGSSSATWSPARLEGDSSLALLRSSCASWASISARGRLNHGWPAGTPTRQQSVECP